MINEKVKKIRTENNISQEELAKLMGISRPTLSQIELGERALKNDEAEKLANIFEVSISEFSDKLEQIEKKGRKNDSHVKLKNLILYILSKCGQKPNMGKILLNKLLYFSDFDYYEKNWESITDTVYAKLPRGPMPTDMDTVLREMVEDGQIQMLEGQFFGYKQIRIIPACEPDMNLFTYPQIAEVDRVVNRFSDMTGKQVSDFSHTDMPYRATKKIGESIDYELVFYRDPKHYTVTDSPEYVD